MARWENDPDPKQGTPGVCQVLFLTLGTQVEAGGVPDGGVPEGISPDGFSPEGAVPLPGMPPGPP